MTNSAKLTAAAAIAAALTGAASADQGRTAYTLEFSYNPAATAEANYDAFRRLARRECETPGVRPLQQIRQERACVVEILDRFVETLGRPEVAALHAERTGRRPADMRDYASRG